ncbi:MAG: LysR family transcriptional regulator [Pseudomonadota bacterium]
MPAYQTLVHIANSGSFVRTAEALNMTLSAVSMQMRGLEEKLNITLFDRTHRPPQLTPLGQTIVGHAKEVLEAENRLIQASNPSGGLAGTYHLGFVATASVRLLPHFLKRAKRDAPGARFEVTTALSESLEALLLSGQLDAAILTASDVPSNGLVYYPIQTERLIFAVPSSHAELRASDLYAALPFLQFNPGSGIGKLIERQVRPFQTEASKSKILLDSVEAIMECVNAGIGFTLLSEPDIKRYAGRDVVLIEPEANLSRQLVIACKQSSITSRQIPTLLKLFGQISGS